MIGESSARSTERAQSGVAFIGQTGSIKYVPVCRVQAASSLEAVEFRAMFARKNAFFW